MNRKCSKKTKKSCFQWQKDFKKKNYKNQYKLPPAISFYQKFTTIISQMHQGTGMFQNATSLQ